MPRLNEHLQQRIWPDLASFGLPPVAWTEKQLKVVIFRPKRRTFLPRRLGWTDKILKFFVWLAKVITTV
jgi:hypothetical protein